jgi:hypothetical protein
VIKSRVVAGTVLLGADLTGAVWVISVSARLGGLARAVVGETSVVVTVRSTAADTVSASARTASAKRGGWDLAAGSRRRAATVRNTATDMVCAD